MVEFLIAWKAEYPINICINIRIIEIHVWYLYAICMDNNALDTRVLYTSIQFSFFSAAFYLYLTPTTYWLYHVPYQTKNAKMESKP